MEAAAPQPRKRPPKWLYNIINPTFKTLLRTPAHRLLSERLMLLSFKGRRTGKQFTIPVGYAETDGGVLIATESPWWKNLRGGAPVEVWLRGRKRSGTADVITDETGMSDSYRVMLKNFAQLQEIIGVRLGPDGEPIRDDVVRARERGHVVVQVRLA
jgi:hypothetical protein